MTGTLRLFSPLCLSQKLPPKKKGSFMTSNEVLYEKAMKAITDLFNDTSVSVIETVSNLENLCGEIETMIDVIDER